MTRKRHHPLIRVIHWLVAGGIIAALVMSAFVMPHIPVDSPEMIASLRRHMSTGLMVFVLTLLRFVMRRNAKRPPSLSSGMPWADWLAVVVHRLFDVLILTMIASGITMSYLGGIWQVVFGGHGQLPASLDALPFHAVHRYAAMGLAAMLALHVGGALFHQFILRDGLMSRMGFGWPKRSPVQRPVSIGDEQTVAGSGNAQR